MLAMANEEFDLAVRAVFVTVEPLVRWVLNWNSLLVGWDFEQNTIRVIFWGCKGDVKVMTFVYINVFGC